MEEEASSLLGQLQSHFSNREQELKQAQADLKQETEAFQAEKKLMQARAVADNDIVDLNVGGTLLTTKRSTLTQAEGSTLAAMFSGRWEQCLDVDANGRVFLDFDPYCFQQILYYLRSRSISSNPSQDVPTPEVDAYKKAGYTDLVKYLALEEFMNGKVAQPALQVAQPAPGVVSRRQPIPSPGVVPWHQCA